MEKETAVKKEWHSPALKEINLLDTVGGKSDTATKEVNHGGSWSCAPS